LFTDFFKKFVKLVSKHFGYGKIRYLSCPLRLTSLFWKSTQQAFNLFLFRKPLSKIQNAFSYENNQQFYFQGNYEYYPHQRHDSYGYQQQIVTCTSVLDISRLTIR